MLSIGLSSCLARCGMCEMRWRGGTQGGRVDTRGAGKLGHSERLHCGGAPTTTASG